MNWTYNLMLGAQNMSTVLMGKLIVQKVNMNNGIEGGSYCNINWIWLFLSIYDTKFRR